MRVASLPLVATLTACFCASSCEKQPSRAEELLVQSPHFDCQTRALLSVTDKGGTLTVEGRKYVFLVANQDQPASDDLWRRGDSIYMCQVGAVGAPTWIFDNTRSRARLIVGEFDGSM